MIGLLKTIKNVICEVYKSSIISFFIMLFFTILLGISPIVNLWLFRELINSVVYNAEVDYQMSVNILLLFCLTNLMFRIIQSAKNYFMTKQRMQVEYQTGQAIINKCNNLSLSDFEDGDKYDLIAKGEGEGRNKIYLVYSNMLSIATQIVSLTSLITIIYSWRTSIFYLIFIAPILSTLFSIILNYHYYKKKMMRMGIVRKISYLQYLLTNEIAYKEIKIYRIGSFFVEYYSKLMKQIHDQDLGIEKKRSWINSVTTLLDESLSFVVIYQVIKSAIAGFIKIGDVVVYIDGMKIVQNGISTLLRLLASIYTDALYVNQFYELMDLNTSELIDRDILINDIDSIELNNVSFKYKSSSDYSLKNINMRINKGDIIVIVGENGAGKSTFIKLLCGFYDNYEGTILINGIDLLLINKENLQKKLGVVFQDFNKYELSLRENVALGQIDSFNDDVSIWKAIESVGLLNKLRKYPNGLETQMGHWFNGEQLSKGQWQRIAIARAFFNKSSTYIFDEPTASLDPKIECEIYNFIKNHATNQICIFVTHRFENIEELNPRVIYLNEGQIQYDKKHLDLIDLSTEYRELIGS